MSRRFKEDDIANPRLEPGGALLTVPSPVLAGLIITWANAAGIDVTWSRATAAHLSPVILRFDGVTQRAMALKIARIQLAKLDRYRNAAPQLHAAYLEIS